jgi:hypothetical protein
MQVRIDCPLCNGGKLFIEVKSGYKVVTTGKMKDLPCKVFCKNCNRFIKYAFVKKESD